MSIEITLFANSLSIEQPEGLVGWAGWLILLGVVVFSLWRWQRYTKRLTRLQWAILIVLLISLPFANLFLAVRLPPGQALPPPGKPIEPVGPAIVLFSALPWVLAAGLLGPAPAATLGLISGILLALWETHSPFTFLETALWAVFLGIAFHQRYRTWLFAWLRHPLFSTLVLAVIYPLFFILNSLLGVSGSLASRLDYAFTGLPPATLAVGAELLIAGLFAEVFTLSDAVRRRTERRETTQPARPAVPSTIWGGAGPLEPSPFERRLQSRFLASMLPLALLLIIALMIGDWIVAGTAARRMLHDRMSSTAQSASESIPFFMETGQNLIQQYARSDLWYQGTPDEISVLVTENLRLVPFFRELYVLNEKGQAVDGYPEKDFYDASPAPEEFAGVSLALNGLPFQTYTLPSQHSSSDPGEASTKLSFFSNIYDAKNQFRGILIGRTELLTNPLTQPVLSSLDSLSSIEGRGYLLNENGEILYPPSASGTEFQLEFSSWMATIQSNEQALETDSGQAQAGTIFSEAISLDGTRRLIYFQPVQGSPWSVVITIPSRQFQQIALQIAAPLLVILLILFVLGAVLLLFSLRGVTSSLRNLALEANRISSGQLDRPLQGLPTKPNAKKSGKVADGKPGVLPSQEYAPDEVGQLRRAFDQMRSSLKARLDELNRLLQVSQGVASSLEIEDAVKPLLESALSTGACSARIVLAPDVIPEVDTGTSLITRFGAGRPTETYASLDEKILALARKQERVVLTDLSDLSAAVSTATGSAKTAIGISPSPLGLSGRPAAHGAVRGGAILALPLRHESLYYGTLWLAYDGPHQFSEDEMRFMTTLAGQAALASANARLFANAEIGRQRLAAILASTPEPVLVTDHRNCLLLANPAAVQLFGLSKGVSGVATRPIEGLPVEQVINQNELLALLRTSSGEPTSQSLKGGVATSAEVTMPDGKIYLATASSIRSDSRSVGRVCILRDITHFKELDALKSDFVATVSHDLRSPLTLMRGYATMLEMVGDLNEQQTSYVRKIVTGIESMTRLVTTLLDLGRIEAGVNLQLEMVPVQDIIERVVGSMQLQASQKQITITTEISPHTIPLIEADHALLQQALHNLLENAVKYTESGGQIIIRVGPGRISPPHRAPDNLLFEVSDTGIGVAPVDLPRLFEKFYRGGQKEARKRQGTGLGLAIVKSIVERHHGQVWVESQLGKGSTFYFTIPFRQ